jgi:hypothetical protein
VRSRLVPIFLTITILMVSAASAAAAEASDPSYVEAIERAAAMSWDPEIIDLANTHGLDIVNVAWEDTGRFTDSAVGPNISDVTIQVPYVGVNGEDLLALMPVIRFPNFTDVTADLSPDDFYLLVGNEHGDELHRITLTELLADPGSYLSDPSSWQGGPESLLAPRDTHVLVSAQAALLPVPQGGEALFNPVIFNYQSYEGDPAVLTILATREGTSITIIDNVRDGFSAGWSWGQRLFFNNNGERASLTAVRNADFAAGDDAPDPRNTPTTVPATSETGLDMVLLIQVPLRQKDPWMPTAYAMEESADGESLTAAVGGLDTAVIGHGQVEGPFTEIAGLDIERDPDYPIRVTVQFYRTTDDGVLTDTDVASIRSQIDRVYEDADYVGSLVVDADPDRPTNHDGPHEEPSGWWTLFFDHLYSRFGGGVLDDLAALLGLFRAW